MKPNKEIQSLIAEIKDKSDNIKKFETDIQSKTSEMESMKQKQQEQFDFNRANDIKSADLAIRNALDALKREKISYQEFNKKKNIKIRNLVYQDRRQNVYQDSELLEKRKNVRDKMFELKDLYRGYRGYLNQLWTQYAEMYGNYQYLEGGSINNYSNPQLVLWDEIKGLDYDLKDIFRELDKLNK